MVRRVQFLELAIGITGAALVLVCLTILQQGWQTSIFACFLRARRCSFLVGLRALVCSAAMAPDVMKPTCHTQVKSPAIRSDTRYCRDEGVRWTRMRVSRRWCIATGGAWRGADRESQRWSLEERRTSAPVELGLGLCDIAQLWTATICRLIFAKCHVRHGVVSPLVICFHEYQSLFDSVCRRHISKSNIRLRQFM